MARRGSRDESEARGWFSMLAIGVLVTSAGFAIGMVAGISWEDPRLLLRHLTGDTDGIEWAGDRPEGEAAEAIAEREATAKLPDVAAPAPLGPSLSGPAKTNAIRGARETSRLTERAAARGPEGGGFAVQVGAFSQRESAVKLVESLRAHGYRVYLSAIEASETGVTLWRVRVGPMATREDAERTARQLENRENLPTAWVLSEES